MKRILTLVLAVMLICMSLSGCGVPKNKPVTEVWLGDSAETVNQLEPGLEARYDQTRDLLTSLSGARDFDGLNGEISFRFNLGTGKVGQIGWQATLPEADAQAAFDKLYAEVKASFGKPNQINDNRKTSDDLAPYQCFWNGKGYMVSVSLTNGLLDGSYYCGYSVMIPLR